MEKKASNRSLHKAGIAKNDEFYTQLVDIEQELKYYKEQFRNKVIFCNCDDPYESNFFKYFASNFNVLKLKKLIATSYVKSPIVGGHLPLFNIEGLKPDGREPYKIEINEVPDINQDGSISLDDIEYLLRHDKNVATPLKGDSKYRAGDFRSDECVKFLKKADIVITNPPFSLFRDYLAQLMAHKKDFLIIGNKNAITYKEVFRHAKDNKIWLGYRNINSDMWLVVPEGAKYEKVVGGVKLKHIMACWFTNLETTKRHEKMPLYEKYSPQKYPKYENYDAIEVSKVAEIPADYTGTMGVPITFLDKHNPEQFEIIGMAKRGAGDPALKSKVYTIKDAKNYSDLNAGPVLRTAAGLKNTFPRILIRIKK